MAKVLIAIPTDGNIRACLVRWLMEFDRFEHDVRIYVSELRPIEANRSHIRKVFLSGCHDWLLQIDSDMQPPANLLAMIDENKDVISADIRTVKQSKIVRLALSEVSPGEYKPIEGGDFFECDAVGGGCLLTSRKAMQAVDYRYMNELIRAEDFDWCRRAKNAGFSIWCDARFRCLHYTICPI